MIWPICTFPGHAKLYSNSQPALGLHDVHFPSIQKSGLLGIIKEQSAEQGMHIHAEAQPGQCHQLDESKIAKPLHDGGKMRYALLVAAHIDELISNCLMLVA